MGSRPPKTEPGASRQRSLSPPGPVEVQLTAHHARSRRTAPQDSKRLNTSPALRVPGPSRPRRQSHASDPSWQRAHERSGVRAFSVANALRTTAREAPRPEIGDERNRALAPRHLQATNAVICSATSLLPLAFPTAAPDQSRGTLLRSRRRADRAGSGRSSASRARHALRCRRCSEAGGGRVGSSVGDWGRRRAAVARMLAAGLASALDLRDRVHRRWRELR
jgi:hypothetical protein